MAEISEDVVVADAEFAALSLVEWFRERLLVAESHLVADAEARVLAEDGRRASELRRLESDRRVVEVERLLLASSELSQQLQQALEVRSAVEQAKGFMVARHGLTPDTAFEAMRRYSRNNRMKLRDVAAEVMTGTAVHDL